VIFLFVVAILVMAIATVKIAGPASLHFSPSKNGLT